MVDISFLALGLFHAFVAAAIVSCNNDSTGETEISCAADGICHSECVTDPDCSDSGGGGSNSANSGGTNSQGLGGTGAGTATWDPRDPYTAIVGSFSPGVMQCSGDACCWSQCSNGDVQCGTRSPTDLARALAAQNPSCSAPDTIQLPAWFTTANCYVMTYWTRLTETAEGEYVASNHEEDLQIHFNSDFGANVVDLFVACFCQYTAAAERSSRMPFAVDASTCQVGSSYWDPSDISGYDLFECGDDSC